MTLVGSIASNVGLVVAAFAPVEKVSQIKGIPKMMGKFSRYLGTAQELFNVASIVGSMGLTPSEARNLLKGSGSIFEFLGIMAKGKLAKLHV